MSYSQSWLEDPSAIRIILAQVVAYNLQTSQEETFYFSRGGYVTSDGKIFNPVLTGAFGFQESISPDGSSAMSIGDVEIHNLNGEYDDLLDNTKYIWSNRSIKLYYGDPGWVSTLANIPTIFLTIFDGIVDDVDSRTTRTVNFRIRDKLEKLNSPLTENKIGTYGVWAGGQQNKETIRPTIFGEVFNTTPVLINPATLEYVFSSSNPVQVTDAQQSNGFNNNGQSENLIEIRDNGIPIYKAGSTEYVGATVDLTNSTFRLLKSPAGAITCSIQGVKRSMNLTNGVLSSTYVNNIPSIIGVILTEFGKPDSRFTSAELDLPTFSNFNTTAEVGILVNSTETCLDVCKTLLNSISAQLIISRAGKVRLIQFGTPLTTVSNVNITTSDILYDSLSISQRLNTRAATKIAYAKNYTLQPGLLSYIPDEHKELFETEWLTTTSVNQSIATTYKLESDPPQLDTHLISTLDAETEAVRLNNYFSQQRTIYSFIGRSKLLSLVLGQQVTLFHDRFMLSSGKVGQVIALKPDWNKEEIEVEVIV